MHHTGVRSTREARYSFNLFWKKVRANARITPPNRKTSTAGGFCVCVEGAMMFLFEALRVAKTMSRGREIFPSGKILVIHKEKLFSPAF